MAVENKEDLTLLQKLSSFYWEKVRETLSTTDHTRVHVLNLGTFTRKHWKVESELKKYYNILEKLKNTDKEKTKTSVLNHISNLERMKAFYQEELIREGQIKSKKNGNNPIMEKSKPDPGGDT